MTRCRWPKDLDCSRASLHDTDRIAMSPIPEQLNPMDVPEIDIQQAQLLLEAGTAKVGEC